MHSPSGDPARIPSLDGIRAVAILAVLIDHAALTRGSPIPSELPELFALGSLGVRIFFVLSGFLITGILLREYELLGKISLPRFYFRRLMRIFPPYYAMLLATAGAAYLGWLTLEANDLLYAFTYTSSYEYPVRSWWTNHTWSLSVEEQFYLLWPAAIVLLGARRAMAVAFAAVLIAPLIRIVIYLSGVEYPVGGTFETACDSIATGCLLASMRETLWRTSWYRNLLESRWFALVPLVVLLASLPNQRPRVNWLVCFTVMNLGIAATLDWCVRFPQSRVGRILNSAPFVTLGVMSYSFYLWQQLFLHKHSVFPQNIILATVAAMIAYYTVERRSLRLRSKIERWWATRPLAKPASSEQPAVGV